MKHNFQSEEGKEGKGSLEHPYWENPFFLYILFRERQKRNSPYKFGQELTQKLNIYNKRVYNYAAQKVYKKNYRSYFL